MRQSLAAWAGALGLHGGFGLLLWFVPEVRAPAPAGPSAATIGVEVTEARRLRAGTGAVGGAETGRGTAMKAPPVTRQPGRARPRASAGGEAASSRVASTAPAVTPRQVQPPAAREPASPASEGSTDRDGAPAGESVAGSTGATGTGTGAIGTGTSDRAIGTGTGTGDRATGTGTATGGSESGTGTSDRSNGTGNGGSAARQADPEPVEDYTRLVPPYSDDSIDSDVTGAVSLRLEIDETGRVARATVLVGVGYGLDEVAVETARSYRFRPARDAAGRLTRSVMGWRIVWESYWKRLMVQTVAGAPNCRGHGPMNLGETHPVYRDCEAPAGAFELTAGQRELPP